MFPYLYSNALSNNKCDIVYNGTLLLFSHDELRNLGHTMNDIMNVWMILWLEGLARHSYEVDMLNFDAIKLGHNFDDQPNDFFLAYRKNFHDILKGVDFANKVLCVKKLIVQPNPLRFFVWESWFLDLPCSFVGPSTLYQRWNMHVRNSLDLLHTATNERFTIMLIVRKEAENLWVN